MSLDSDDDSSPFVRLLCFCAAMFASSAVCGAIPLFLKVSPSKLRIITTIGVGLLIGTAFIVILPEGVHSVYAAAHKQHHALRERKMRAEALALGNRTSSGHAIGLHAHPNSQLQYVDHAWSEDDDDTYMQQDSSTAWIGATLAAGFVFMMLIDRLSSHGSSGNTSGHTHDQHDEHEKQQEDELVNILIPRNTEDDISNETPRIVTVSTTTVGVSSRNVKSTINPSPKTPTQPIDKSRFVATNFATQSLSTLLSSSALIGIMIHSAVDGIAQGAISAAHNHTLETIVFFAIVLHKGPAAFGLISFLVHQNKPVSQIRMQLFLFSLSAPFSAICTYFFIAMGLSDLFFGHSSSSSSDAEFTTSARLGLCLLFSGGTFLFTVAAHILPEIQRSSSWRSTLYVVIGIMFPLILSSFQSGHEH